MYGVEMYAVIGELSGEDERAGQESIYSVVITEMHGIVGFEMYQIKGVPKARADMAGDLQKAKDWLDSLDRPTTN
jgi:hypothetical protein